MKYEFIKIAQTIILLAYSLYNRNPFTFFVILLGSYVPHYKSNILVILYVISLIPGMLLGSIWIIEILLAAIIIGLNFIPSRFSAWRENGYVMPLYVFVISITTISNNSIDRDCHLIVFYIVLLISIWNLPLILIRFLKVIFAMEGLYWFLVQYSHENFPLFHQKIAISYLQPGPDKQWWQYSTIIAIILLGDLLRQGYQNEQFFFDDQSQQRKVSGIDYGFQAHEPIIQLHQLENRSQSEQERNEKQQFNQKQGQLRQFFQSKNQTQKQQPKQIDGPPRISSNSSPDSFNRADKELLLEILNQGLNQIKNSKQIKKSSSFEANAHRFSPFLLKKLQKKNKQENQVQINKNKNSKQEQKNQKIPFLKRRLTKDLNLSKRLKLAKKPSISPSLSLFSQPTEQNISVYKSSYNMESSSFQQADIMNIFLLVPFICFNHKYIEIPIYGYCIYMHYNKPPFSVYILMLLSTFVITFVNYNEQNFWNNFILRACMVLIVQKKFYWIHNIGEVVKMIWLNGSFVIVLAILFWFGLMTVNVFHLILVVIMLMFITKSKQNKQNASQQHSFRHRNWVYLLIFFNVFIVFRLLYAILVASILPQMPEFAATLTQYKFEDILSVLGINYHYSKDLGSLQQFNIFPFIIANIIGVQYWTYNAKIVHSINIDQEQSQTENRAQHRNWIFSLLTAWNRFDLMNVLQTILHIIKLFFYKLLPWFSYLLIFGFLIIMEFSITSFILLIWISLVLTFQIVDSYRYSRLYKGWLIFSRLTALQIILRYVFQFAKFDLIAVLVIQIPWFELLLQYQQFLGLLIRSADETYFKALTKFQLMIGSDFFMIFIAFLMTEYLWTVIKYEEIKANKNIQQQQSHCTSKKQKDQNPNDLQQKLLSQENMTRKQNKHEKNRKYSKNEYISRFSISSLESQDRRIVEIYQTYIDFKITVWFAEHHLDFWLYQSYKWFLKLYLPIIAIIACLSYSVLLGLYLFFILKFYLTKNTHYYNSYIGNGLSSKIRQASKNWNSQSSPITRQALELQEQINKAQRADEDQQLQSHISLRKWLVGFSILGIVLTYFSRIFSTPQIGDFIETDSILKWDWIIYVLGPSCHDQFAMLMFVLLLIIAIAQTKIIRMIVKKHFQQIKIQKQMTQFDSTVKKFIGMQISLLFGSIKVLERFFVFILIFASIIQDKNAFAIVYLICAWLLNSLGASSAKSLSRVLFILIMLQYFVMVSDFSSSWIYGNAPIKFDRFRQKSIISNIFSKQWVEYFQFGDSSEQVIVMILSIGILVSYELFFWIAIRNWKKILNYLTEELSLNRIQKKIYSYFNQTYFYALIYSPLCITILCLSLYLMDYTGTNLFLSILSLIFLFKSFLIENYADSRNFWKSYFYFLQLLILLFMLIYCILSIPQYRQYCNPIFCSEEEFRTKVTKAILLFILQVGVDLMKSHHFITYMKDFKGNMEQNANFSKLAIAYKINDIKILKRFRNMGQKINLQKDIEEVRNFIGEWKKDHTLEFKNQKKIEADKQSWLDVILDFLPSLVDPIMLITPERAKEYILKRNALWISENQLTQIELQTINETYLDQFGCEDGYKNLQKNLKSYTNLGLSKNDIDINDEEILQQSRLTQKQYESSVDMMESKSIAQQIYHKNLSESIRNSQKNAHFPEKDQKIVYKEIQQQIQKEQISKEKLMKIQEKEKKNLLYLLIIQSIISNWHYLTYIMMIAQFIRNMGLITAFFPLLAFMLGLIQPYQATKTIWRLSFVWVLVPITWKFLIGMKVFQIDPYIQHLLMGDNQDSIFLQFSIVVGVLIQCLLLKIIGLYDISVGQVQCMRIALIRNIINNHQQISAELIQQISDRSSVKKQQININHTVSKVTQNCEPTFKQKKLAIMLLSENNFMPQNQIELNFTRWQKRPGYDYSTLLVTCQLTILFYIFFFYDRMTVKNDADFYNLIQYNQFTGGMVIMALVLLLFMLLQRFLSITDLTDISAKWDINLILKYVLLIVGVLLVHFLVIIFFPFSSVSYTKNIYVQVFYVICALYFLVSALQIKYGLQQHSRGFMQRFTWYLGFVYLFFRAIPFLFQFKVFSDWTVTKTSLRLFDWIKFQEIFGRLYVAKCNSLFMRGKIIGSKIQWWKKLLMGYPLLLAIILLLFGPLILFSSLNPLAKANGVVGGYLQLTLKVNKTNQYTFYTNTHITDIHYLTSSEQADKLDQEDLEMIKNYDINQDDIQIINLQDYSDQYWEISQGSYDKLLDEPEQSLYQLSIRIRFQRNMTGTTPIYVTNTYEIPLQRVDELKSTLQGNSSMKINNFLDGFLRLDNNNGLHVIGDNRINITFHAELGRRTQKKYWVIQNGIQLKIASDKYSEAIFGYSVMSFYISIILVIANYFRFLFQGSAHTIIMSDIPYADPILRLCQGVYQARSEGNILRQQHIFWEIIDIIRSPDLVKSLTGDYLDARLETKEKQS